MEASPVAKRYFVSGTVQGVGYRYFARQAAQRLGMAGFVKNLRDGRVEVYAIGPPAKFLLLRTQLERGPNGATVSKLEEEDAAVEPKFASRFSVERENPI